MFCGALWHANRPRILLLLAVLPAVVKRGARFTQQVNLRWQRLVDAAAWHGNNMRWRDVRCMLLRGPTSLRQHATIEQEHDDTLIVPAYWPCLHCSEALLFTAHCRRVCSPSAWKLPSHASPLWRTSPVSHSSSEQYRGCAGGGQGKKASGAPRFDAQWTGSNLAWISGTMLSSADVCACVYHVLWDAALVLRWYMQQRANRLAMAVLSAHTS